MAMPLKSPEMVTPGNSRVTLSNSNVDLVTRGNKSNFRCESCDQRIESLRDVIIEDEYGFEGEAWGTFFRQEPHEVAISACCRANIIDSSGESMDAYILKEEL
jgi:hypothetical protein